MFRNLIRSGKGAVLPHRQYVANDTPSHGSSTLAWILIVMLGVCSVIAFLVLWLKA